MKCFDVQNYIMQYVNGELPDDILEGFLKHVCQCDNCKEELEICFTIVNGMKELEGDKALISDFKQAFDDMLQDSMHMLEKKTKRFIRKLIIMDFILFSPMFFMFGDSNKTTKKIGYIYNKLIQSNFVISNLYYFDDGGLKKIEDYVYTNKDNIQEQISAVTSEKLTNEVLNEIIEDESIANEDVASKIIKDENAVNENIESKIIKDENAVNENIASKIIEDENAVNESIESKIIEDENAVNENIESKIIED